MAEVSTFIALGWQPPANILDAFTEFRNGTNGLLSAWKWAARGIGILWPAWHGGLQKTPVAKAVHRADDMDRDGTAARPRPTGEADTLYLVKLLERLWPRIVLDDALLRGDYMRALAMSSGKYTARSTHL